MENKQKSRGNITGRICIYIVGICYALYLFYTNVRSYVQGGESAPSMTVLIVSGVVLVGGAIALSVLSWKLYRDSKREQKQALPEPVQEEG